MVISNKDKIIKRRKENKTMKYDERKILAIGYYYCMSSSTYGKQIDSCKLAGYSQTHSEQRSNKILELDRFTAVSWHNLNTLLPLCTNKLQSWLNMPDNELKVKDIREVISLIRLIGDSVGKFIKREMKVEAKLEEKHIYHHFDTLLDEKKYYNELRAIANKRMKELNE